MMRAGISPDTGEAKQGQHRVNIGLGWLLGWLMGWLMGWLYTTPEFHSTLP